MLKLCNVKLSASLFALNLVYCDSCKLRALHHEELFGQQWSGLRLRPHHTTSERAWGSITWTFVVLHVLADIEDAHELLRRVRITLAGHDTTSPLLSLGFMLPEANSLLKSAVRCCHGELVRMDGCRVLPWPCWSNA